MSVKKIDIIAASVLGPTHFWKRAAAMFERGKKRGFVTFEEWDGFLEAAREVGLAAVVAASDGEPTARFATPLGHGLLRLYRALQYAKAAGFTPKEFEQYLNAQVDEDITGYRKRASAAAARRSAPAKRIEVRFDEPVQDGVPV